VVRGVGRKWVRNLYKFAVRPNLAFYFRVPLEVAIGRILGGRNAIKFYEAGMDLGLSRNVERVSGCSRAVYWTIRSHDRRNRLSCHRRDGSIEERNNRCGEIVMQQLGESLQNTVLRATQGDIDAAKAAARIL